MTSNFNVENFEEIKNHDLQLIENIHYEEQKLNTRFYLAQAYQSFSSHLTNTFQFQLLTFFFWNTPGVHTKLNGGLFLNLHKKKMGFYPNSIVSKLRDERMKNQPIFFSRKFIENNLENNRKVGFSWQPNTLKQDIMRRKPMRMVVVVSLFLQHRKQILGF